MMDLSPVPGLQGRASSSQSQVSANDFADELKKEPPRKSADSSRQDATQEAVKQDAEVRGETSRDAPLPALSEGESSLAEASTGDPYAVSDLATVEQVLSARVFGLHLQASGYLSEYRLAARSAQANDPRLTREAISTGDLDIQHASPDDAATTFATVEGAVGEAADLGWTNVFVPMTGTTESQEAPEALALPQSGAGASSELRWHQRALRLIARPDGKYVAWLRDYMLSEDEARQLATGLVQQMKGQGMTLQSIMWNGHEIWSSMNID